MHAIEQNCNKDIRLLRLCESLRMNIGIDVNGFKNMELHTVRAVEDTIRAVNTFYEKNMIFLY